MFCFCYINITSRYQFGLYSDVFGIRGVDNTFKTLGKCVFDGYIGTIYKTKLRIFIIKSSHKQLKSTLLVLFTPEIGHHISYPALLLIRVSTQ